MKRTISFMAATSLISVMALAQPSLASDASDTSSIKLLLGDAQTLSDGEMIKVQGTLMPVHADRGGRTQIRSNPAWVIVPWTPPGPCPAGRLCW